MPKHLRSVHKTRELQKRDTRESHISKWMMLSRRRHFHHSNYYQRELRSISNNFLSYSTYVVGILLFVRTYDSADGNNFTETTKRSFVCAGYDISYAIAYSLVRTYLPTLFDFVLTIAIVFAMPIV